MSFCRKKKSSKGKYEMAWNKTQAVILYAVLIWALYGAVPTREFTATWAKGGGARVEQIRGGEKGTAFEFMQTGANGGSGGGMPSY